MGEDGTARLWALEQGRQIASLSLGKSIGQARFLKNATQLLLTSFGSIPAERTAWVWDASEGAVVDTLDGPLLSARVGDNVLLVLYSREGVLRPWSLNDRRELSRFDSGTGKHPISAAALSADGNYLALGWTSGRVAVWQVRTGQKVSELHGHETPEFGGQIQVITFSHDGKRVLTGSVDRTARLWEVRSGRQLSLFAGHEDWVTRAVFDPDDAQVITLGGGVHIWDADSGVKVFSIPKKRLGFIFSPSLADDGSVLTVLDADRISVLNMFPSPKVVGFPTRSALIEAGRNLRVEPLSGDERRRFYLMRE